MSCDCEQGILPMPAGFAGCSWIGFEIEIEEDGGQADLESVVMEFKTEPDLSGTAVLTLSNGSGLTIISASPPWRVGIDDIEAISLAAETYYFDVKFTDSTSMTEPLLAGAWTIKPST